ncbi:FAD:protein FMN transferase [Roseisalinus antarcticus]|uniref:FAD:protein FMN transferase n=1 Tax=Roseisalinus antarcticus TaxID=254357 RepID=A0A1Y5RUT0_9RHOB|nr:FAD:protein FMN transferase [Roseisalinus antarcticus]SLN25981.1 Thiamine biosynthesis lipoprotein ApbE precursor [Roseisalinus antarcticus]
MRDAPKVRPSRRRFLGLVSAAVALPHVARADLPALEVLEGPAFGTRWRIVSAQGAGLAGLRGEIDRILGEVDRQMSPWRTDSEIGGFNRMRADAALPVSADTATVAEAALTLADASGGRFDPTVGPLVARWGFGPIRGDAAPGWRDISVAGGRLAKARPGLTLDLCGIAKGWALDRLGGLVRTAGLGGALIDLGGELAAVGLHPAGRPWQVAVEQPLAELTGAAAMLGLTDACVATSGTRAQAYGLQGREVSHIIDPATGAPVAGDLRSVTVVAPEATGADGWATALFAAGAVDGPALAREQGLNALFLAGAPQRLRAVTTGEMDRFLI